MLINDYLKIAERNCFGVAKPIICEDGYCISVQGSSFHYCNPRIDNADLYSKLELGFPNKEDELINDYAEDSDYCHTVYGYVPVEIVDKLMKKHGGIHV